jgi:GT2 family glycosyltransferase
MDLSIIIVSWKVKEKLLSNLKALSTSAGAFKAEVFIVDNDSQDGTVEAVQNFVTVEKESNNRFNWYLIENAANLGFSKANNLAIRQATGEFILLLNPDMEVFPDTLEKMLAWCRSNPQATVTGCRLEDAVGHILPHVRSLPGFSDQLAIVLKLPYIFPKIVKSYWRPDFDYSHSGIVDSVRGAFMMINVASFKKIGHEALPLLDERYFIWFEDGDFCRQIKELGGEVWYTPVAACRDYVAGSFSQVPRRQTQRYFRASMLLYFRKWEPAWQAVVLDLAWNFGFLLVFLADKLRIKRAFRA